MDSSVNSTARLSTLVRLAVLASLVGLISAYAALGFVLGIAWMSIGNDALDGDYLRALKTMGGSGVNWIDAIFRYCVVLLVNIAKVFGISYEALNIWVFVIIQPLLIAFF